MTQNSGGGYPASGYPASGYPARPSESLAQLVQDAANQFENVAQVLGQQYDTLDNATSGLLSGTFPWTGLGSDSFASAWQNFGSYIQQLQQACQNTHDALSKLSNRISDVEGQQGWNILLTIIGGIATIISFAAMIAELGLDPFVDGFFGIVAKFTEQEGADVANVAEEITQADSEAASELEQIEADLTASPTINGSVGSVGNMPGATSPINLDVMILGINDEVIADNQAFTNRFFQQDPGDGTGSGLNLTSTGKEYLQKLKDMGVIVYDSNDDPDLANYMTDRGARGGGVTWFNGVPGDAGPDTTTVILGPEADDAAVYEEYLHVQRAAARGWTGLDPEDALVEEIEVEEQVLSQANELNMTPAKQAQLQQNIASYRQELWDQYHKNVP